MNNQIKIKIYMQKLYIRLEEQFWIVLILTPHNVRKAANTAGIHCFDGSGSAIVLIHCFVQQRFWF